MQGLLDSLISFPSTLSPKLSVLADEGSLENLSLDAAGFIALADLSTVAQRTALKGDGSWFDILILAPGLHRQQAAAEVNKGEFPACGAMTTGYVFRVENQATVAFLQRVGKTGHLTTVQVVPPETTKGKGRKKEWVAPHNLIPPTLYFLATASTISAVSLLGAIHDTWALIVLCMLITARLINTIVIKRRATLAWKGAHEPGKMGDLLVLLSQDRWVRIKGSVDDLKTVASGQWMRDQTMLESFFTAFATLLVYISAALVSNATTVGSLVIATLLLVSVALLGLSNSLTRDITMYGRTLTITEAPKAYFRRLDLAKELIEESGRDDWAIGMGMILPNKGQEGIRATM